MGGPGYGKGELCLAWMSIPYVSLRLRVKGRMLQLLLLFDMSGGAGSFLLLCNNTWTFPSD